MFDANKQHYLSFGSVEGILKSKNTGEKLTFEISDALTGEEVVCLVPLSLIDKAKNAIGKRVYIYGLIYSKEGGEKIDIDVREMEPFPGEKELPTIADIMGILSLT